MAFYADGLFPSDIANTTSSSPTGAATATTTAAGTALAASVSPAPTRLYLTNTAAGYTPATKRGAWDLSTASLARQLGPVPSGTATTAAGTKSSATTNYDVLLGRWISDPIDRAGNLSGTVQWIIGVLESSTNANMVFHLHIFVTQGDSDVVRGTVLANDIGGLEWATAATGRGESTRNISTVACSVGDRVVVEIGYQAQTTSTGFTGTINYGNTGTTDLGSGGTGGTTGPTVRPGWIEFSDPNRVLAHHTETLVDNFNDNTVDTVKWPFNSGTVAETGGQARVTALANNTFSYYETAGQYTLADSSVTAYMAPPSPQDSAGFANARLTMFDVPSGFNTYVGAYVNSVTGTLGWFAVAASTTQWDKSYTPTGGFAAVLSGGWYRIVESAGNLSFYVSLDGVAWGDPVDTQPTPAAIRGSNRLTVDLEAIRATSTAAGSPAVFDNINLPPVAADVAATVTAGATAAAAITAAVDHTTSVTVSAGADSGVNVTPTITVGVTAVAAVSSPAAAAAATTVVAAADATTNSVIVHTTTAVSAATANVASTGAATRETTAVAAAAAATANVLSASRQTTAAATSTANVTSRPDVTRTTVAAATATASAPGVVTGYRQVTKPLDPVTDASAPTLWSSADVFNGNRFRNRGTSIVIIRNTSGADVTATFRYRHPAATGLGRPVTVPADGEVTTAVWPAGDYTQADGAVWIDWSSGSGVSLAVVDCYPAW